MSQHELEHISICLEAIAFFLVTIDLYGRNRLELLQNKITNNKSFLLSSFGSLKLFWTNRKFWKWMLIIYISIWILIKIFSAHNWLELEGSGTLHSILIFCLDLILSGLSAAGLMIFALVLIPLQFLLFIAGIDLIYLPIAKIFLKTFGIEGVMLVTGSALFILAKAIAYYAVAMKWEIPLQF